MAKKQATNALEAVNLKEIVEKVYKPKKVSAIRLAEYAVNLGFISANRAFIGFSKSKLKVVPIEACGEYLKFATTKNKDQFFLYDSRFCNWRFCPMCERRKSLHRGFALSCIMRKWASLGKRFVFITLTTPNVSGENFSEEVKIFAKATDRMMRRKKYKNAFLGGIRKLEVTYNSEMNTFNIHVHYLCCVEAEYFDIKWIRKNRVKKKTYPNMISHEELLEDWRRATGDYSITQVDIRALPMNRSKLDKAILEVSKYTAKDTDMAVSEEVFKWFYLGLKNRRLFSPFGVFKDDFKLIKKDKTLFKDFYTERVAVDWFYLMKFVWSHEDGGYKEYLEELDAADVELINKKWLCASLDLEDSKE